MATTVSVKNLLLFLALLSLSTLPVHSTDFAVNGDEDWAIPASNNTEAYNKWASNNRFQVGDTVRFKYKKDSVMVVSEEDYNECRSTHPVFFSNSGKTEYKFDKPGLFYFISGVDGHCERGQKMVIKVIASPVTPGSPLPEGPGSSHSPGKSDGALSAASLPLLVSAIGNAAGLLLWFC